MTLPAATVRQIMKEIADICATPIDGFTLKPNEANVAVLEADLLGPEDTPYYGGTFVLRLTFDSDYPRTAPKGFFLTKVFHPNVGDKGEICVNTLKKDWNPQLGIRHTLMVIRCLLVEPNPESALNEEAARLLLEHYDEFSSRARMMTTVHAASSALRPSRLENKTAGDGHGDAGEGASNPLTQSSAAPPQTLAAATEKKKALKRL